MAETTVISPDLDFVRAIRKSGGDTVKKCMQCANCSVVCRLSPTVSPFPRKEMVLAQWGMREELLTDPDIWHCFGCTDCSIQCPRGARPGDIMAAVRKEAIRKYSPMGFVQTALSSPKYLPILLLAPIVLWSLVTLFADPDGKHSYFDGIFPPGILEPVLGALTLAGSLILFIGAVRYWKALVRKHPGTGDSRLIPSFVGALIEVFTHAKFRKCEEGGSRALGHLLMLMGFALLFIGGTIVGMAFLFLGLELPLALTSPLKILLNVGAIGLVAGTALLIRHRATRPERRMRGTWFDWFFLVALLVTGVTGILTEVFRELDFQAVAFGVYFVHLVCVFCLLGYAPWSKLAHLVYRTVAMAHARFIGVRW